MKKEILTVGSRRSSDCELPKKNFSAVFILDEQPTQTSTKKGIYFKILVVWFVNLLFDISSQVYPFPPFHPSI